MKEMKILSLADVVNIVLSLIKTPTFLDAFLHTSPICLLKFKCLSHACQRSLPVISFQIFNIVHINFRQVFFMLQPEIHQLKFFMITHE